MTSTLIVGAGPIGLACAISARRRGFDPLVIDAGAIADSIVRYPVGMTFFTTPERLEIGGHPITCAGPKPTREEALMYYRCVARAEGLRVRTYTRLVDATSGKDGIDCRIRTRIEEGTLHCDRLVLATGYFDHANRLGIPGESLPHVSHYGVEPHVLAGLAVVIVGGKNSAVELALTAFRAGARVTLVHRGPELGRSVKYWLRPDLENRLKAKEIAAHFGAQIEAITEQDVRVRAGDGTTVSIPADRVFLLTGYHPDFDLFRRIGLELDQDGRPAHDPATLETTVRGVYVAGSVSAGRKISEIFIENGRYDGEKIFGDPSSRASAEAAYAVTNRPVGE